jgi:MFS family permease
MQRPSTDELPLAEHAQSQQRPWYAEVTRYQWLVLLLACAGWIFDIYENQIFAVTRGNMLGDLLNAPANSPDVKRWGDFINSFFLVGGAVGGVFFGALADRYGRGRSMVLSILVYAVFSALTAAAQNVWHVVVLRFLVATGTGGEWAVAAALVSEVFPKRARAHASGIFHASSILGGIAAGWAGILTGEHWRIAFLIGLLPALLVFAVRFLIRDEATKIGADEPIPAAAGAGAAAAPAADAGAVETGPAEPQPAPAPGDQSPGFASFWTNRAYRKRAILGLLLAGIGLTGYWGVYVAGQDLAREFLLRQGVAATVAEAQAKSAYSFYQKIGDAVGLFSMGPLCAWLGRRRAFLFMQAGAIVATPIACFVPHTWGMQLATLALMAFFVNGMHAGYAVWFPELFPRRLRATGAGICFNGARLFAAPALAMSGLIKAHMDLRAAVALLGCVYVLGLIVVVFLPETKGAALEE